MLFPDRSVEENIFATVLPIAPLAFVNRRAYRRRVEATLDRLGASIALGKRVGNLPLAHRQLVEIARALCAGGTVLVLDEPTSALSQPEAQGLFDAIRGIVAREAAVIFVSHRLDEVFAITDRLTVLRDGHVEGRWRTTEADIPIITRAMVGQLADEKPRPAGKLRHRAVSVHPRSRLGARHIGSGLVDQRWEEGLAGLKVPQIHGSPNAKWHRPGRRADGGGWARSRISPPQSSYRRRGSLYAS